MVKPAYQDIGGNPNLRIESVFAFVANGPDGEGIMAASVVIDGRLTMLPLIGADMDRIKSLVKIADEIAEASGHPYKIYRFDNKVDITEEVKNA